jgi:hypothetical protein
MSDRRLNLHQNPLTAYTCAQWAVTKST